MPKISNKDKEFVELICQYVKDIQDIKTDDLDDKLSQESAIVNFLESRKIIHKSVKSNRVNYVEIDVIFDDLPNCLFTLTDNKIAEPNTKDDAFYDWYENKSYMISYIEAKDNNTNLIFCIEEEFVELKLNDPKIGLGKHDADIINNLRDICDKIVTGVWEKSKRY